MPITIDRDRGQQVAELLYGCFSTTGIHGRTEMPEDIAPKGVARGSLEHVLFIALTVTIDYQRDANALWGCSRRAFEDPETRYLFDPRLLHEAPLARIGSDMKRCGLSRKYDKDPYLWRTVGVTFYKKWDGDPRNFLADCGYDAPGILERLKTDHHLYNERPRMDYPYLRGPKIGPLWLRMLRDNVGITELKHLERVPIPVDIHVARATLATGVVRGQFKGSVTDLFEEVRRAWFESVPSLRVKDRAMIALDVDEPLWHLSKYGCTHRDLSTGTCPLAGTCEAGNFCVKGKVAIHKSTVEVDT